MSKGKRLARHLRRRTRRQSKLDAPTWPRVDTTFDPQTREYIASILDRRTRAFSAALEGAGYPRIAIAVANADLGFLGGAPVNPNLKPGQGPDYSTVRHAEGLYTFTMIHIAQVTCRKCHRVLEAERHDFTVHHEHHGIETIGHVIVCHHCEPDSPLFGFSHMPRAIARRKMLAKNVV